MTVDKQNNLTTHMATKIKSIPKKSKVLDRPKADALAVVPLSAHVDPFSEPDATASAQWEIRSLPPLILPHKWPKNAAGQDKELTGRFVKAFRLREFAAQGAEKARVGTGIEIRADGSAGGVALPLTAVLRKALDVTGDGDEATSPNIGKVVKIMLDSKNPIPSKQGQAAHNFKVAIRKD